MKLSVLQENLKKGVTLTSHFISSKAQLPILGNILLKADKNKLILSSTNLETSVSTSIGAKVDEAGEIAINGKTLNDVVLNLSSGTLDLEVKKEQIKLSAGNFKSNILGTNSSDFPKVPKSIGKKSFSLKRNDFILALSRSLFAVSVDETRPILTGVLFVFGDYSLTLVATDGFRLTQVKLKTDIKSGEFKVIIPKAVLNELVRMDEYEEIQMSYDLENNQVIFGIGDTVLSSRIIEGNFPDYEKIIPKTSICTINVDKYELEKAVKLASVFARDAGNIVKFKILNSKLQIIAESSTSGSQETEIEVRSEEAGDNKEIEIMFNFKFIEEVLKVIEDDEIQIIISPSDKASKFLDPKSPNFLHIIMPIKTQN